MKLELVVFDMAGTTVRDEDAVNTCFRQALAAHGVETTRDEVNAVMGIAKPVAIRHLLERKAVDPEAVSAALVEAIHRDFLASMVAFYETAPGVGPMPHAEAVVAQLRAAGIKVALDTGFSRPIVNAILERLGWRVGEHFDASVTSDEVRRGRPHADLILRAMELTGIANPRAVAKVGDTPADLLEGQAAGCGLNIGVTNGSHSAGELACSPHTHLISSLSELPGIILAQE